MKLTTESFKSFHEAIHGYAPFAWQQRLLDEVVSARAWPQVLDVPTGAGKTTCLDIALFVLALNQAEAELWAPRRIAMVVDRRVVVDQVAERGRKLATALRGSRAEVVSEVARRLGALTVEPKEPLGVYTLRGGVPRDDGWTRSPDQPLIIASTVDQLGSRLLMQGYGVSASMAPVHAGLLANDTLVLTDEVHLSEPFAETLEALTKLRSRFREVPRRFHYAFLSATPSRSERPTFTLTKDERTRDDRLRARLSASKPAELKEVSGRPNLELACLEGARELATKHQTTLVVVNRVLSATTIARQAREALPPGTEVVLLTGRMRPLDRDALMQRLRGRIMAGRTRDETQPPLVVVATQCVEAGADFDFDCIVTEAASLSALRQRFGRVDRLGEYGRAQGIIVRDKGEKNDPIYGESLPRTWAWLEANGTGGKKKRLTVDFGVEQFPPLSPDEASLLSTPGVHAPPILPAYVDLWSQTNPAPAAVPDVSLFLHGPRSGAAEVQLIWRADLTDELLSRGAADALGLDSLLARVGAVRPSSLEAIGVPFVTAKRWLHGEDAGGVADVEGALPESDPDEDAEPGGHLALRWRGEASEVIDASALRPGDTIVVPSARGGLFEGSFDGSVSNGREVSDVAEQAALFSRGVVALRLNASVLRRWGLPELAALELADIRQTLSDRAATESGWPALWLGWLGGARRLAGPVDDPEQGILLGRTLAPAQVRQLALLDSAATLEEGVDITTDDEDSSFLGRQVTLAEHSTDVRSFAKRFAEALRLPKDLVEDLAVAGWVHDIGKADRRFQVLLRGGDEVAMHADATQLAKSGTANSDREGRRLARKASGYPSGLRHELQSLAMLTQNPDAVRMNDRELVLHLVSSHHGHCRPFAPAVADVQPVEVLLTALPELSLGPVSSQHHLYRLDSQVPDRFWRLQRRFGWLELCWLEAILRLADHRASEAEQEAAP